MSTSIGCLLRKQRENGILHIPRSAWKAFADMLASRYDAELNVHDSPSVYWIVAVAPGDARTRAIEIMEAMDREIDKLTQTYTKTHIPQAR
jgi:hypothetical protein